MADVVAGLLLRDGKVLLGLRKMGGKRGGLWEMPGGKVDQGESHALALMREWQEECGVPVGVGERIAVALLDLEVCFTVTLYEVITSDEPKALDHAGLQWMDLQHAIEYSPCSPAMYLHWPLVRVWLARRREASP